jgi:leucyl/phenylalanyl-tRNA---protein transferase
MPTLTPEQLLELYTLGLFPMADENGEIELFSPDPRAMIDPAHFHPGHSLEKTLRAGHFEIRIDAGFETVMRQCAARVETWISEDIIASYVALHEQGHAHSVETWMDGELAGGLYGVALGGAFFGESMFFLRRDASKIALAALVARMRERGMTLLDVQYTTPHLRRFGAVLVTRREYLVRLRDALRVEAMFFP